MPNWKKVIVSGSDASLNSVFATRVTASIFSGSFTGSLQGTASWALSASWAPGGGGASFPYTGSAVITGSLVVTGSGIFTRGLGNLIELESTTSGSRPYIKLFDSNVSEIRINSALGATYGNVVFENGFAFTNSTTSNYTSLVAGKIAAVSGALVATNAGGDAQVNIASPSGFSNYVSFRENGVADRGVIGYANGTSYLQIRTNGATSMTTGDLAVVVDNTGSVGIGTTSPTAKLDVNGSGNFSGATLKINSGNIELGVTGGDRYFKTNLNPLRFFIGAQLEGFFDSGIFQYRNRIAVNSTAADGAFPQIYLSSSLSKTITSARGGELAFSPQASDQPTYGVIKMLDSAYTGFPSTISHIMVCSGQNTSTSVYGDVILQHDGTVARGRVGIGKLSPNSTLDVSGSVVVTGSIVATSFTGSLLGTSSFATSASSAITASYVLQAVSSSFATNATNAATASSADNFTVRGTLTAQTIVTQVITSSTDFVTGSTRFGSLISNTHQFTGSVGITGSLSVVGSSTLNGSVSTGNQIIVGGASSTAGILNFFNGNVGVGRTGASGLEFRVGSNTVAATIFSTGNVLIQNGGTHNDSGERFQLSGSSRFTGNMSITGSLTVSGGITGSMLGTASYATDSDTLDGNHASAFVLNSQTSSMSVATASFVTTAQTASYVLQAVSASFAALAQTANTASFVTTAQTASYVLQAVSASFATSASQAVSSSFASNGGVTQIIAGTNVTISPTNGLGAVTINSSGGGGSSFPYTGSAVITGSLVLTGSFDIGPAEFNATSSATTAGTTIVSTYATGSANSAFYNYYISSGSNARAGQIMSVWSGSTIQYSEVTTNDIGNTNTASFAVTLATGNVRLSFTAPGVWTVRSIVNLL